jgi:hypothetical protein
MKTTNPAAALVAALITDTRSDGSQFLRLADGSPNWMRDAVWAAHDEELPNDWRYGLALAAAEAWADQPEADPSRLAIEVAESIATAYTSEILNWYAELSGRIAYADEARDTYGIDSADDIVGALQLGQHLAAERGAMALFEALEEVQ